MFSDLKHVLSQMTFDMELHNYGNDDKALIFQQKKKSPIFPAIKSGSK